MALNHLQTLINDLQQFDYGEALQTIVADNTQAYEDMQAEQMAMGKDVNGDPITLDGNPEYQPATIEHKKRFGQGLGTVTDRVTRYQTGALYRELFAKVTEGQVFLSSSVDYWDSLLQRIGSKGTGLDPEMRLRFAEQITIPRFRKMFYEKTGLVVN